MAEEVDMKLLRNADIGAGFHASTGEILPAASSYRAWTSADAVRVRCADSRRMSATTDGTPGPPETPS
jgi:hypothetical protein